MDNKESEDWTEIKKELLKLRDWFKQRIKWFFMGRPSSALWDAIFANYDKSPNWKYTPFPKSLRDFIKYEYIEDSQSKLGEKIVKIIKFFNPSYIRLIRFEATPQKINVCWTKFAEAELDKLFSISAEYTLMKDCTPPTKTPIGLFEDLIRLN